MGDLFKTLDRLGCFVTGVMWLSVVLFATFAALLLFAPELLARVFAPWNF